MRNHFPCFEQAERKTDSSDYHFLQGKSQGPGCTNSGYGIHIAFFQQFENRHARYIPAASLLNIQNNAPSPRTFKVSIKTMF